MIDEDFCCRDHREKYFSSFRKALTQLPDLEAPVVTAAAAITSAPASITGEPVPADPRAADFLPTAVTPSEGTGASRSAPPDTLAACGAIEIPEAVMTWGAGLEHEHRPAELVEPIAVSAAAIAPELHLLAPMLATAVEIASGIPVLQCAGMGAGYQNGAAGEAAPCARAEISGAAIPLVMPSYAGSMTSAPSLMLADVAGVVLFCEQPDCVIVAASEIPLPHECHLPSFTASRESMQLDEVEVDADATAVPELAPMLAMSSSPVGHTSSQTVNSPFMMRPALGLSSPGSPAQLTVPALSSRTDARPSLAPEAGIPSGQAANAAAGPRSHEAVRPSFWSSVRIKNWRLRITFAKPA